MKAILISCLLLTAIVWAEDPAQPQITKPAPAVDWPQIFRDLQAADAVVKDAAAQTFARALEDQSKTSKKPYFARFKTELTSGDENIRATALRCAVNTVMMFVNGRRTFPEMIKDLMGADEKARIARTEAIYKVLETNIQSTYASALIEKLGDDNKETAAKAEEELRGMKGDAADDLANGLDDDKTNVKKKCAELLKELGADASDAIDTLLFKLRDDEDKQGRKLAVQVLEALGPNAVDAIDGLKDNLDDDDKVLRKISVNILKKIGPAYKTATSDLISQYLTHTEVAVRNLAADLLINLGADAKEGVKDLIEILEDEPAAAAKPPTPVAPPAPNTPAPAAAQGADAVSKGLAMKILASIGPDAKEALPILKKYETSADDQLKEAAKDAITKISVEKK